MVCENNNSQHTGLTGFFPFLPHPSHQTDRPGSIIWKGLYLPTYIVSLWSLGSPWAVREKHGTNLGLGGQLPASWALFSLQIRKRCLLYQALLYSKQHAQLYTVALDQEMRNLIYFLHKQELKGGLLILWSALARALQIRSKRGGSVMFVLTFCQTLFILWRNKVVRHVLMLVFNLITPLNLSANTF